MPNLKPIVYAGSLNLPCSLQIQFLTSRKEQRLLPAISATQHDNNRDRLADILRKMGYKVRQEVWLQAEFDEFILSHPIDLYVENEDTPIFIEVKPSLRSRYQAQIEASMLLIALNNLDAEYWVFEYQSSQFIPQKLANPHLSKKHLEQRLGNIINYDVLAYPGDHCRQCQFLSCEHNPLNSIENDVNGELAENLSKAVSEEMIGDEKIKNAVMSSLNDSETENSSTS